MARFLWGEIGGISRSSVEPIRGLGRGSIRTSVDDALSVYAFLKCLHESGFGQNVLG